MKRVKEKRDVDGIHGSTLPQPTHHAQAHSRAASIPQIYRFVKAAHQMLVCASMPICCSAATRAAYHGTLCAHHTQRNATAEVGGGADGDIREATNGRLEEATFRIEALEKENDRLKAALKVSQRARCSLRVPTHPHSQRARISMQKGTHAEHVFSQTRARCECVCVYVCARELEPVELRQYTHEFAVDV